MAEDQFSLHLNLDEVSAAFGQLQDQIQKRLQVAAKSLAIQTHAHVTEQAASKLHARREMFMEALDFEQEDVSTWAIIVREKGRWIEDGMQEHSMLDDLLKSPKAKTAKDGSKYLIIPFKHNKGPTQRTPQQSALLGQLKQELKKVGVKYGGIERNADGSPKTGLLHKFDFATKQKRPGKGQAGAPGFPTAANSLGAGQTGPEGRPYLNGVRIYQHLKKNPDGSVKKDNSGQAMASREIFTFRVASSKQQGTNKWFHPGLAPMNFLEEAYNWAKDQWDNKIEPEILTSLLQDLKT